MVESNESNYDLKKSLFDSSRELDQASIAVQKAEKPQSVFRVVFDLSKEQSIDDAKAINRPFKSVFVEDASNPSATVFMRPTTNSSEQDYFKLGYNASYSVSTVVPRAFFHWPVQAGTITLIFFSDAEFKSGSQISINSGGVSINEGATVQGPLHVTLAPGVAAEIAPQDFTRKTALIQNKTGSDIYIGASNTVNATTNEGVKVVADGVIEWRNTAALYGFSVAGGKVTRIEERS